MLAFSSIGGAIMLHPTPTNGNLIQPFLPPSNISKCLDCPLSSMTLQGSEHKKWVLTFSAHCTSFIELHLYLYFFFHGTQENLQGRTCIIYSYGTKQSSEPWMYTMEWAGAPLVFIIKSSLLLLFHSSLLALLQSCNCFSFSMWLGWLIWISWSCCSASFHALHLFSACGTAQPRLYRLIWVAGGRLIVLHS